MNDSEFIELLNLYLDHEITPADAARLEAEVRGNPERRRTYLEYCRMQKACALLAADFAADRPAVRRESVAAGFSWAAAGFASFGVVAAGLAVAFLLWQRLPVANPEVPAVAYVNTPTAEVALEKPLRVVLWSPPRATPHQRACSSPERRWAFQAACGCAPTTTHQIPCRRETRCSGSETSRWLACR